MSTRTIDFVIVVYRNKSSEVERLASALLEGAETLGATARIHIVVNDLEPWAGSDRYDLHQGHGNIGFAAGVAVGVRAGDGEQVVVVNPDCEVSADNVGEFLKHTDCRAVYVPRLLGANGSPDHGAYANFVFTPGRKLSNMRARRFLSDASGPKPLPRYMKAPGAFISMPRAVISKMGGMFDEAYFLYAEDRAATMRVRALGVPMIYVPVAIEHRGGGSGEGLEPFVLSNQVSGCIRYAQQRLGIAGAIMATLDQLVWLAIRRRGEARRTAARTCLSWFGYASRSALGKAIR